jgi:hypothetical protein
MARVLGHFGLPADPRFIAEVGKSPVLTRYSKAPEYDYTPELRVEVLSESRQHNAAEIRKGMRWLEQLAGSDATLAALVNGTAVRAL